METALRVLSEITKHCPPDPYDIDELRRLAPTEQILSADELAREVIQQAIRSREKARVAGQ